ncbi:hypothetical protein M885DRAFT_536102 [Pelagophyceae sp. CCMP2097]|nr:hypothetical protein M885DRAFT_536102 [Pelagophyceae sp. CCMP2097]
MWARGGQARRAPSIGAHLMTGEFAAMSTAAGDAPWVGRILRFGSSQELPEGHADRTAGDGGDYGGEEGHARGMPPSDDAAKSAGLREIVLLRESSWHPIACVLDAVIVLPACLSHDVSGMGGVFVAKFEQGASGSTFSRVAADSVGAFPDNNATFGADASGRRLVQVSRTSKLWTVRRMLRKEIHLLMRQAKGLVNSTVISGVDAETWSIIVAALDGVALVPGKSVKKTYAASTCELLLYRVVTSGSTVAASFVTTAVFVALDHFLGDNWNVSVNRSRHVHAQGLGGSDDKVTPIGLG